MVDLKYTGILGGCLAIVLAVVFGPRLEGDFVWDDVPQVENNDVLEAPDGYKTILSTDLWGGAGGQNTQLYHPVPMLSLWLQTQITGKSIVAYRIFNVLVHLLTGIVLFLLLRRLKASISGAVVGTVFFVLHPSVTEPVMWLTGRHDTLGALATLCALFVWPRPEEQRQTIRILVSGVLSALALLSKEPYIIAPIGLFLLELSRRPPLTRKGLLSLAARLLIPGCFTAGVMGLRAVLGISSNSAQLRAPILDHGIHYGTIVFHYAKQLLTLSNGPTTGTYHPLSAPMGIGITLVFAVLLLVLFFRFRPKETTPNRVFFGLSFFGAALSPHLLSLPILQMYGNRYAYLPLAGIAIVIAAGWDAVIPACPMHRRRLVLAGSILLGVVMAISTSLEATNWSSDITLYGADLLDNPDDSRTLYHYGHAVRKQHGCRKAASYFEASAKGDPTYWRPWHNLAGCLINLGRYQAALTPARRAVALRPQEPRSLYNLAVAELNSGEEKKGLSRLRKVIELSPGYEPARRILARYDAAPPR